MSGYYGMTTTPLWAAVAHRCATLGTANGVALPGGVQGYLFANWLVNSTGSVTWRLVHRDATRKQQVVAVWHTDWLPERAKIYHRPCKTNGKLVEINSGTANPWLIRVRIDSHGLPVPEPVR